MYKTPFQKYGPIIAIPVLMLSLAGMAFWIFGQATPLIMIMLISAFVAFGR